MSNFQQNLKRNKRLVARTAFVSSIAILTVLFACTGDGKAKEKPAYAFKSGQGPAGVMLSINGKNLNEDALMGDQKLEFAEALKRVYDLRMDRVGELLLEDAYGEKSKAAKQSLEEYLDKEVFKGEPKVSDTEYNKFVKEKNIPKEQLNAQLKERILNYMKAQKRMDQRQALITKLSKSNKVEIYFSKPDLKVSVDIGSSPFFGSKTAKVQIVEFSDFQCPFCSRAAATVTQLKKEYGNKVQLAFKQYPLPMHAQAKPAAEASLCVNDQGSDKFWKYHDKLFANTDKLDMDSLKKYAKEVGAKEDQFNQCMESKKFGAAVDSDIEYGNKLGVRSTPTFFINGRLVSGAQPLEAFKEIIDEEMSGG